MAILFYAVALIGTSALGPLETNRAVVSDSASLIGATQASTADLPSLLEHTSTQGVTDSALVAAPLTAGVLFPTASQLVSESEASTYPATLKSQVAVSGQGTETTRANTTEMNSTAAATSSDAAGSSEEVDSTTGALILVGLVWGLFVLLLCLERKARTRSSLNDTEQSITGHSPGIDIHNNVTHGPENYSKDSKYLMTTPKSLPAYTRDASV